MIDTQENALNGSCPMGRGSSDGSCWAGGCLAWRTVDGDADHGFCGMVPVLPFQLRASSPEALGQACLHGAGAEIIGQPGLPGSAS